MAGFFFYAVRVRSEFFAFLAMALFAGLVILLIFYRRFKQKKRLVKLQREEYSERGNLLKADLEREGVVISVFRDKIVSYSQLKGLLEAVSMCLTLEDTVHTLCREARALFAHQDMTMILYLVDSSSGGLSVAHASRQHHAVNMKVKTGDIFDRWVLRSLQSLYVEDTQSDFRFDPVKAKDEGGREVRSLLSVPLVLDNKPVGIIRLDSPLTERFSKEDLRFLKTIGDVAAVAVENAGLYDRVEDLAVRDGLTGLFLRRYLMEHMSGEAARHLRRNKEMAFAMFDLDHFKSYNDRFGHIAGDIVLKTIGEMMKACFNGPGDLVCRYGGEEFCVLASESSLEGLGARVRDFAGTVEKKDIILRRERTRITLSAGVASFPGSARTCEGLIQAADAALYEAKKKGRNRVCIALSRP